MMVLQLSTMVNMIVQRSRLKIGFYSIGPVTLSVIWKHFY